MRVHATRPHGLGPSGAGHIPLAGAGALQTVCVRRPLRRGTRTGCPLCLEATPVSMPRCARTSRWQRTPGRGTDDAWHDRAAGVVPRLRVVQDVPRPASHAEGRGHFRASWASRQAAVPHCSGGPNGMAFTACAAVAPGGTSHTRPATRGTTRAIPLHARRGMACRIARCWVPGCGCWRSWGTRRPSGGGLVPSGLDATRAEAPPVGAEARMGLGRGR